MRRVFMPFFQLTIFPVAHAIQHPCAHERRWFRPIAGKEQDNNAHERKHPQRFQLRPSTTGFGIHHGQTRLHLRLIESIDHGLEPGACGLRYEHGIIRRLSHTRL